MTNDTLSFRFPNIYPQLETVMNKGFNSTGSKGSLFQSVTKVSREQGEEGQQVAASGGAVVGKECSGFIPLIMIAIHQTTSLLMCYRACNATPVVSLGNPSSSFNSFSRSSFELSPPSWYAKRQMPLTRFRRLSVTDCAGEGVDTDCLTCDCGGFMWFYR